MSLTIYAASAGSGKTFKLAARYISLVLSGVSPRSILAVTFTNKATAEMKDRILESLYGIKTSNTAFDDIFCEAKKEKVLKDKKLSDTQLRDKASKVLDTILNDYDNFSITTIDSFLQVLLGGLAQKLKLDFSYKVELNDDDVINEAVNRIMGEVTDKSGNKELSSLLMNFIRDSIEDEKSWDIREKLKTLSRELRNEQYLLVKDNINKELDDKSKVNNLKDYKCEDLKTFNEFKNIFDEFINTYGKDIKDIWSYHVSDIESFISKLDHLIKGEQPKDFKGLSSRILKIINEGGEKLKQKCTNLEFANKLIELNNKYLEYLKEFNTFNLSKELFNELQILRYIEAKVNEVITEQNKILLSRTPVILSQSLNTGDASFILERAGIRYNHIMIDEFQDTSASQWKNFKPLIEEILSKGWGSALLVGDVKQSIYRWRGGDWNILNNISQGKAPNKQVVHMIKNYRCCKNIMEYNVNLFKQLSHDVADKIKNDCGIDASFLSKMYDADFTDTDINKYYNFSNSNKGGGYVKVNFFEKEKEQNVKQKILNQAFETIRQRVESGIKQKDIMMLFRNKGEIKETADFLENLKLQDARYKSLNIVSREAFNLNSSVSVNMIICALRYLHDNEDKQSLAYVMFHYYNEVLGLAVGWSTIFAQMNCSNGLFEKSKSLPDFPLMDINQDMLFAPPLYDLIEKIIKKILYKDAQRAYSDDIYLTSFLDEVMSFLESHSGDIGEFIEYWNNEISKHTIPASESNAIEVMTIHKSKGLERDVVVIPFCDWEWCTDRHSSIEWCKPNEAPYNAFSSLPIRRKKIMADSIYKQDYYEEHSKQYVDNLNLLYVAFTRAKNEMYVYGIKDKDKSQRVSSLLNDYETQNLETPETPVQSTSNINSTSSINVPFCSHDSQITFRQSNESKNFLEDSDDDTQDSYIKQGTLLHTIYSMINKKDDADKVVTEMFNIGVINADEKSKISQLISRGWQNKQVSSWFDGSWNISNECTILTKDNYNKTKKLRPDRVMTKNDETIVIDFKFGKPNDNYKEQVSRYMRTLTLMGYPNVSGYLWYVYDNKIEQV